MQAGMNTGKNTGFWAQRGVPTFFQGGTAPAFDMFSLARGMEGFFYDVYDEPELVKAACNAATQKYCDKLIDLAMDGGFIVGNGCEVPMNAKIENMRVFLNCCR